MTEYAKTLPEHNPADVDSLEGLLNFLGDKMSMWLDCCLPGVVTEYNQDTRRATVKLQITGVASLGQKIPKEAYTDIPVFMPGGGGFEIKYPVNVGDTGWLIACDRNISLFKQNKTESAPNDYRKHCFEDGFFLLDSINGSGSNDLTLDAKDNNLAFKTSANLTINDTVGLNGSYTITNGTVITVTKGIVTNIS